MIRKLEKERLLADLGALESLLGQLAPMDYLARVGLESRQRGCEKNSPALVTQRRPKRK